MFSLDMIQKLLQMKNHIKNAHPEFCKSLPKLANMIQAGSEISISVKTEENTKFSKIYATKEDVEYLKLLLKMIGGLNE